MRYLAPGLIALLLAPGPAFTQSADGSAAAAAAALQRAQTLIAGSSCPSATARAAAPPARLSDASVREASYHRILVEGCGQRSQRNYLAVILQDGSGRLVETLPGNTVTDPVLQRDAMQAGMAAAGAAAPACRQIRPVSGTFDGEDSEPTASPRTRPWAESWVFNACGTTVAVPMRFTPTARGTSFAAGTGAARAN